MKGISNTCQALLSINTLSVKALFASDFFGLLRGFIKSRLPAVYRRLCCHKLASHRRLMMPDFHSNRYSDRRLLLLTQAPTPKVIETPAEVVSSNAYWINV